MYRAMSPNVVYSGEIQLTNRFSPPFFKFNVVHTVVIYIFYLMNLGTCHLFMVFFI